MPSNSESQRISTCRVRSLHELETGEFRAEPLSEVLSRDEIDPETLVPQWDSKGTIVLKKASWLIPSSSG